MFVRLSTVIYFTAFAVSSAPAADTEQRLYDVSVDGKPAGDFRLTVRTADDGTETATAVAAVNIRFILGGYRYAYRGTEVWAGGRLRIFARPWRRLTPGFCSMR